MFICDFRRANYWQKVHSRSASENQTTSVTHRMAKCLSFFSFLWLLEVDVYLHLFLEHLKHRGYLLLSIKKNIWLPSNIFAKQKIVMYSLDVLQSFALSVMIEETANIQFSLVCIKNLSPLIFDPIFSTFQICIVFFFQRWNYPSVTTKFSFPFYSEILSLSIASIGQLNRRHVHEHS